MWPRRPGIRAASHRQAETWPWPARITQKISVPGSCGLDRHRDGQRASWHTRSSTSSRRFPGDLRHPLGSIPALPLGAEKIIVRRAALSLSRTPSSTTASATRQRGFGRRGGGRQRRHHAATSHASRGCQAGGQDYCQAYNPRPSTSTTRCSTTYEAADSTWHTWALPRRTGGERQRHQIRPAHGAGRLYKHHAKRTGSWCLPDFTSVGLETEVKYGRILIPKRGKIKKVQEGCRADHLLREIRAGCGAYVCT
jgi:hypothetical protein